MYKKLKKNTTNKREEVITNEIAESKNPNSTANIYDEYIIR